MIKAGQTIAAADFVINLTAGEALTANDAVYIEPSDGKAYKCDADLTAKLGFFGFAQETVSASATVNVVHTGQMTGFTGLTAGAVYYVSGTAGAITATAPSNSVIVGIALSTTVIQLRDVRALALEEDSNGDLQPVTGVVAGDGSFELLDANNIQPTQLDYEDEGGNVTLMNTPKNVPGFDFAVIAGTFGGFTDTIYSFQANGQEKVLVQVRGTTTSGSALDQILLYLNGVLKDTIAVKAANTGVVANFLLNSAEVLAAGNYDVTLFSGAGYSMSNLTITILRM